MWAVASTRTCRRNAWRPDHVPDQAGGRRSGPARSRQLSRRDGGGAAAAAGLDSRVTLEAAGCPFFCAVEIVTQSHPSESVDRWPRPRIGFCGDDGSGGAKAKGLATCGLIGSLPDITLFSGGA